MQQIPAPLWTLVIGIGVTLISLWLGQNNHWLPEQASEQAPLVDELFNVMVTIGTALFIVVQGAIIYSLIRFRRRQGDHSDGLPIEGNLPLEAFWTAIPAIIVVGLSLYSVVVFQEMGGFSPGGHHHGGTMVAQAPQSSVVDVPTNLLAQANDAQANDIYSQMQVYGFGATPEEEGKAPDLTVNVTGMQYAWIFRYPDTGIVDGELHLPVGRDVQLLIQAQDVIHSFWVPQFRLKQDALPGQPAELRFVASREGTYPVVCAELCGAYHGGMRTQVIVHSQADYETWVNSRLAQAPGEAEGQTLALGHGPKDPLDRIADQIAIAPQQMVRLTDQLKPHADGLPQKG